MFGFSRKRSAEVLDDDSSSAYHYDNSTPKSGKWTVEEETFAKKLIIDFEAGNLADCADGCTLRAYLSRKLNCAPMRISKKYAGQCIGKHAYTRRLPDEVSGAQDTRDSDSPSASTSSAASSSSSSSSSDSSTISEPDHAAEEARRAAEVSYGTLAEFQVYSSYPQSGGMHQYARQPVTLVSLHAGPGGSSAVHPTPLYPMAHFAAGAGVHPAQAWMGMGMGMAYPAVVQRPCELEGEGETDGDDHVGLDIDNPYQQQQAPSQGCGTYGGYSHGCSGYPGGLRSVSTDYSCVTACSSSSNEDQRGAVPSVDTGRRTPDASPNLVSKAIPHCTTTHTTNTGGAGQVVTPRLHTNTTLAGHFASAQGSAAGSGGSGSAVKGKADRADRMERVRNEAEEWRAVLTYFTSSPRTPGAVATVGTSEGVQTSSAEEEEQGRLVRRDSSFLLHRNASYSSLFV